MNSSDAVLSFFVFSWNATKRFQIMAEIARKSPAILEVATSLNTFSLDTPDPYGWREADKGATASLETYADLKIPLPGGWNSIIADLELFRAQGSWIARAEYGWRSAEIGLETIDSRKIVCDTVEHVMESAPDLIDWLEPRYLGVIAELKSSGIEG